MIQFNLLLKKLAEAYENGLPFVGYNKPNSSVISSFFQKDDTLHYVKDFSEEGFVFSPFDAKEKTVLIPNELSFSAEVKFDKRAYQGKAIRVGESEEVKKNHIDFVTRTREKIQSSNVSKIVIARAKEVSNIEIDVFEVFERLVQKYKHATCYIWFHPKVGLWMGATPETLVETKKTHFKTMSLAGTQRYIDTLDVVWGGKELEEQQLVTDYVLSNLESVTSTLEVSKTYTAKAGALLHLRTDIQGQFDEENSVSKLINVLHPTPAVCGFPREESKAYILQEEKFDRSFYTGFFGELNVNQMSSLYVNLRCMELLEKKTIRLYVGGGITDKSNPEKEWEETVAKCKTMESIL